jgi:hypothetical protein
LLLGPIIYWCAHTPSHDGEWSELQTHLPEVVRHEQAGGVVYEVRHLRDFRYHSDGSPSTRQYLEAKYDSSGLHQVWFGISHFGEPGLAHTFLSFEFADDVFLVASVEARLRPHQSYNPLFGMARQYSKMIVLGTEADVIGLRTHSRGERVLLYPLKLDKAQSAYLLHTLMDDVRQLARQPSFYHTLFDNCATNLLKYDPAYRVYTSLLDYRLLLPGFADGVVQEKGWITARYPLEELRSVAQIDSAKTTPEALDFSRAIRRGWDNLQDR